MSSHDISIESPEGELLLTSSLSPAERAALGDFVKAVQSSLGSEVVDVQFFGSKARGGGYAGVRCRRIGRGTRV
jgi:hypothetical protein